MRINKIYSVYFSPVGSTGKVSNYMAGKIGKNLDIKKEIIDFTLAENREKNYAFSHDDLVIFAMPTYAGRIPNKILPFVKTLFKGKDTPLVIVASFGNRSFDNNLIEQKIEMEKNGFKVIGGAALVNEHVFSPKIASSRPDQRDYEEMDSFLEKISNLIKTKEDLQVEKIPGDRTLTSYYTPLKDDMTPAKFLKAVPKTKLNKCTDCKVCALTCPMGVIDYEEVSKINRPCIKCQACIKKCPENAKYFDDEDFLSHIKMLEKNYTRRAENKFFLPY